MFSRLNVRTKLLVMLVPAIVGLCGLAGLGVKSRIDDRSAAQLTRNASDVAVAASRYVHALQAERLVAATLAEAPSRRLRTMLDDQQAETDAAATGLRDAVAAGGADLAVGATADDLGVLRRGVERVESIRAGADGATGAAVTDTYSQLIELQLAAVGRLEFVAGDGVGKTASRRWLAAGIEAESKAAAVAASLLGTDPVPAADGATDPAVTDPATDPTVDPAAETDADGANPGRSETAALAQELVDRAGLFYDTYTEYAGPEGLEQFGEARSSDGSLASDDEFDQLAGTAAATEFAPESDDWPGLVATRLDAVEAVETAGYAADIAQFAQAADDADSAAVYFAAAAAASCLLVTMLAFGISRHISGNLRRLTGAAREISEEQVPALVQSLKSGTGVLGVRFTEVETNSRDELADVGNALNELGRAMVAVASEQQQSLRKGISDIFVNLARRNQTLLDRQIQFIDRLESNEQDPDQLENLFRLDHLATRMRRNAESLLVLAGAEAPRRRARDVALSDVIRVAVGEVEDFARISLAAVEDAEAVGSVAVDIAHLLAELMENGAQYSPPERSVDVVGHRAADGGYTISISDRGVGMTAERLEAANRLLASPPPVGLALTRALGFVVAGTLANRHGIGIHVAANPSGGVTAEVTLPPALIRPLTPAEPAPVAPPVVTAEPGLVGAGWTADGEYLSTESVGTGQPGAGIPSSAGIPVAPVAAAGAPVPDESPAAWDPMESITWSEERLPAAPAPSKLVDMLPEGTAFEQGLYSLLGESAPEPPAFPPAPAAPAAPVAPSAGTPIVTTPFPPAPPAGTTPASPSASAPAAPPAPQIPGLWAPPIVHPRPQPGAGPIAPPAESSAAPLPRRSPGATGVQSAFTSAPIEGAPADGAGPAGDAETGRTAAPLRAPDEVRSVLSRYRSGLDTGRTSEHGFPPVPPPFEPFRADPTHTDPEN